MNEKSKVRTLFRLAPVLVIAAGCTSGVVSQAPGNAQPGADGMSGYDADCQGNAKFQETNIRKSSDITQTINTSVSFPPPGPDQAINPQIPIGIAKLGDPYEDGKIVYAGGTITISKVTVPATVENVGPVTPLPPAPPPAVYSVHFTLPITVSCSTQVPAAGVTLTLHTDGGDDSFDPANVQCKSGAKVNVTLTRNWTGNSALDKDFESKQIDLKLIAGQDSCNLRTELNQ